MFSDLFDSPWKILIVAVVLIVLFGSKKLPHAARSLGQSMRILKKEMQGLHEDQSAAEAASPSGATAASDPVPPPAAIAAPAPPDQHRDTSPARRSRLSGWGWAGRGRGSGPAGRRAACG